MLCFYATEKVVEPWVNVVTQLYLDSFWRKCLSNSLLTGNSDIQKVNINTGAKMVGFFLFLFFLNQNKKLTLQ